MTALPRTSELMPWTTRQLVDHYNRSAVAKNHLDDMTPHVVQTEGYAHLMPPRYAMEWNPRSITSEEIVRIGVARYVRAPAEMKRFQPEVLLRVMDAVNLAVCACVMGEKSWLPLNLEVKREAAAFMCGRDADDESATLRRVIVFNHIRTGVNPLTPHSLFRALDVTSFNLSKRTAMFIFVYVYAAIHGPACVQLMATQFRRICGGPPQAPV